jgi:hypothetical protein
MKYIVIALFLFSKTFGADVPADHQIKLMRLWWLTTENRKPVWLTGNSGGDMPSDAGWIEGKTIRWNHGDYDIINYESQDADSFSVQFKFGTISMNRFKGRFWQGKMVRDNGNSYFFRIAADSWPDKTPIDFYEKK